MSKLFTLPNEFIEKYANIPPIFDQVNWGLGKFVYARTYSRMKDDGTNEQWYETIQRVVEGTFSLKKKHFNENHMNWKEAKEMKKAQKTYDLMFNMKFLPGGRGLWAMGSRVTEEKNLYAAVNNCAFRSTSDLAQTKSESFAFFMDASMLGIGVGFDTNGAGKILISNPDISKKILHRIEDSREGWVNALSLLLDSYFEPNKPYVEFDYDGIRKAGTVLAHFGGTASGPGPLIYSFNKIREVLDANVDKPITSRAIVDIMNLIGLCVVSGNIRRTAALSLGFHDDKDFMDLKNYSIHPEREEYGWLSNNSINAKIGMDYTEIAKHMKLNGEPGIAWLENMRKYSRINGIPDWVDINASGANPCMEQTLENCELCCVSGDTMIQTKNGVYTIESLVNKEVEIYNGEQWSKVTPFIAGKDKDLYRVWLNDGSYLDCTEDHKWCLKKKGAKEFKEVETREIIINQRCIQWNIPTVTGKLEPLAYEYGLFSGDGYIDCNTPMLCVCGEKDKLKELDIPGSWRKPQIKEGYNHPYNRLSFKHVLDFDRCVELNKKSNGLPSWVFEMDDISIRKFIAGLIDTDGNVCHQTYTDNVRIFGNEEKIRDLQILLRRININHASVYIAGEKGARTNKGVRNYSIYCCYIPSYECGNIPTRIKKIERIGSTFQKNNAHENSVIDNTIKQKIIKVEKLDGKHTTYCFTEPLKHMGVFNNVLTYQCLSENFINRHDTFEEYLHTLKYAFHYSKIITLGLTQWPKTNDVIIRNRRIGCSMTGITNFLAKRGIHTFREWCNEGYKFLKTYDKKISGSLGIPLSIKITSIKPSGTVSLLPPNTCSGMHYPESRYYIRRVRMSKTSTLLGMMKNNGYHIEDDVTDSQHTAVISFPVDIGCVRTVGEVSMWEQLELASVLQECWADNQVSCTVTFDPEKEGHLIEHALNYFQYKLKGVSFLPRVKAGAYPQMPYEEISAEKYEEMMKDIMSRKTGDTKIKIDKEDQVPDVFCTNSVCMKL